MSVTDLHARNDRILSLRARGLTQRQIAHQVGLTERQVRRILSERAQARILAEPPGETTRAPDIADVTVTALIDELEHVVASLALKVAAYAGPRNRAAAVAIATHRLKADAAIAELRFRSADIGPGRDADMSGHLMSGQNPTTNASRANR